MKPDPFRRFVALNRHRCSGDAAKRLTVSADSPELLALAERLIAASTLSTVGRLDLRIAAEWPEAPAQERRLVACGPLAVLCWGQSQIFFDRERCEVMIFAGPEIHDEDLFSEALSSLLQATSAP